LGPARTLTETWALAPGRARAGGARLDPGADRTGVAGWPDSAARARPRDAPARPLGTHRRTRGPRAGGRGVLRPRGGRPVPTPHVPGGHGPGPPEAGRVPRTVARRRGTLLDEVRPPAPADAPLPLRHRPARGGPLAPLHGRGPPR